MTLPAYTNSLNQVATYWAPLGPDGFGGVLFDLPIVIACRWQDQRDLVRNNVGQEVVSSAVVYPEMPLQDKGYLVLGDVTDGVDTGDYLDPKDVPGSREIISVASSPDLSGTMQLNKVWL